MKRDAGWQRKPTALAMSTGSPLKPIGGTSGTLAGCGPEVAERWPPISPTLTVFTVTPLALNSLDRLRVIASSPPLPACTCTRSA